MIASDAPNWIMVGGTGVLEAVFLAMSVYFCLQVGACMHHITPHTSHHANSQVSQQNTQVYLYVCTRRNSRKSVFWPSCRPATRIRSTSRVSATATPMLSIPLYLSSHAPITTTVSSQTSSAHRVFHVPLLSQETLELESVGTMAKMGHTAAKTIAHHVRNWSSGAGSAAMPDVTEQEDGDFTLSPLSHFQQSGEEGHEGEGGENNGGGGRGRPQDRLGPPPLPRALATPPPRISPRSPPVSSPVGGPIPPPREGSGGGGGGRPQDRLESPPLPRALATPPPRISPRSPPVSSPARGPTPPPR